MQIANYSSFLVLTLSMVYSPGPMTLFILGNSIEIGFRRTLPILFGASTSYLLSILIFSFSLAGLLQKNPYMTKTLQVIGIIYLLYLAYNQWKSKKLPINQLKEIKVVRPFNLFKQGFITALSNPKTILLFSILLPQFVSPNHGRLIDISLLGATFLILQFSSGCFYGLFGEKIQHALKNPSYQHLIKNIYITVLLCIAILLAISL